ncbi:ribosome maturation factor RimP [Desulfonatronospira sp.]|uniref:ribosome maturation factor RimP n=1 Tax=Desulfonatronospira sp. TaxID=1962951 RepID=UPI0025C5F062|nr:ribosome maturation factor RimP [Desulfonatronospira sp.]
MDYKEIRKQVEDLVQANCTLMGLEPWGVDLAPGTGRQRGILRVFVDSPGGVTIDQCVQLSRQLSAALDVEDLIPGSYNLEVSSPGLYRRFYRPDQMQAYVREKVKITLREPRDGRKNFTGTLQSAENDTISIKTSPDKSWSFQWDEIDKARLVE